VGLRSRPMQPTDVSNCVEVLTKVPAIGRRYGSAIADVRAAWQRLIGCEAMGTAVFEEVDGAQVTTWGVGVGVFVHDAFVRELKTPPLFWVGPELAKRVVHGDSPILSDKQVLEANSTEGLNLLVWEGCPIPEFAKRPDAYQLMVTAFIDLYRGFRCKEAISSQAESAARLQWIIDGGGLLWDAAQGHYVRSLGKDLPAVFKEPHIVGTTPEIESQRLGSWVGPLFDYRRPQLGFSRGEQRLLLAALPGRTDEELCRELGTSVPTVKSMWRTIFNRAASRLPELFPDHLQMDARHAERGKEKRRHLLAHLREHPEELRPVSRRLYSPGSKIAN